MKFSLKVLVWIYHLCGFGDYSVAKLQLHIFLMSSAIMGHLLFIHSFKNFFVSLYIITKLTFFSFLLRHFCPHLCMFKIFLWKCPLRNSVHCSEGKLQTHIFKWAVPLPDIFLLYITLSSLFFVIISLHNQCYILYLLLNLCENLSLDLPVNPLMTGVFHNLFWLGGAHLLSPKIS